MDIKHQLQPTSTTLINNNNNKELPFPVPRKHSKFYIYYSTMGYIFQIVRDIDPKLRFVIDTFTLIGFVYSTRFVWTILSSVFNGFRLHIWSRIWFRTNFVEKYGKWAVITGATDGIGLEYARQFAQRGLNIILLGRNSDKLTRVRTQLLEMNRERNIQVISIQADLNSDDRQMYQRIWREIDPENREIGILVNNAGVMFDSPNRFLDQPETKLWEHVRVNMLAVLMITRLVLPSMVKRKRGLVINISSIAGYQPLPLMGVYSASKVFVEWFSQSLDIEYRQSNIEIQTLIPNYIGTKMTGFSTLLQRRSLMYPDAETFTANAIATIGRSRLTSGYWFHDLSHFFTKLFIPNWAYRQISWYFLKQIDSSKVNKTN
uniref:Hydroxysteroid dehydrogenase-like protein 1 n=1 Tax=Dermatophagoides pteronyssinus TaxID=6956 RepID=A0A6P6XQD9_DERPT|nr:hydroxysteroid dehydrogenase-like protein 1 [Dermatophagoides pteronyssinus]